MNPARSPRITPPKWARDLILLALSMLAILPGFRNFRDLLKFGFTPQYLGIADTTIAKHRYTEELNVKTADADTHRRRVIVAEVQREPLYPAALIFADRVLGSYGALRYLQLFAMIASLWLWGRVAWRDFGPIAASSLYAFTFLCPIPAFYTSVLYPYSFQFFLVTLGAYLLINSVQGGGIWTWISAGAALGLAPYERGAYLALPVFIALALLIFRKRLGISPKRVAIFLLIALAVPSPWLLRNRAHGASGMNQMTGYSLGFTFGDLASEPRDDFERGYDQAVADHGTDNGTLRYIQQNVAAGRGSFGAIDRRVARYVMRKCIANPSGATRLVALSVIGFPYRLCDPSLEHLRNSDHIAAHYWKGYAVALGRPAPGKPRRPDAVDLALIAAALLGLGIMVRQNPQAGIVMLALLVYTVLFSTMIVTFDPRYRGAADPVLFIAAGVAISRGVSCVRCLMPTGSEQIQ